MFLSGNIHAQYFRTIVKGRSDTKKIVYRTKKVDENAHLKPDLEIISYGFTERNGNGLIDPDEQAGIEIQVLNQGDGTARDVFLNIDLLSREIKGLSFEEEISVGNIYPGNPRDIHIPINAKSYLNTGVAHFRIQLNERFGYSIDPINLKIGTNEYVLPEISIKEAYFSTDEGGKIRLGYPIYLKLLIENNSPKDIQNLQVDIGFDNEGCLLLEDESFIISSFASREIVVKEILFTAKKNYPYDIIPIKLHFHDKHKMYSNIRNVNLDLNQPVASKKNLEIDKELINRTKILVSDVDTSIPYDSVVFPNRYALIIGNEDYTSYQTGLKSESNVVYAENDARVFRKYVINTLGVPENNVFAYYNATYAEMKVEIERISKILEKSPADAELIFYYAGHGLPDESTRMPYLIPVDVSASNVQSAIKLQDIYQRFSQTGSKRITLFIDACFSGGGRASGLMATRAFSVEPKYELLKGNMIVFLSSSGSQSSLPYHNKQHGIFTYFLLRAFKESNGKMNYGELSDYLTKNVSIESLRINSKEQDPQVNISSDIQENWKEFSFK